MTDRRWWGAGAVAALLVVAVLIWTAVHNGPQPSGQAAPSSPGPSRSAPPVTARPSASPSASPAPSGGVAACVDATVGKLSLAEQAGQLLMVGTPVEDPQQLSGAVARYHLGGVFLAGRSTRAAGPIRAGITAVQRSARLPLLVSL